MDRSSMKRYAAGVVCASVVALVPGAAAAQCEGGNTVAGYYLRDGTYVPGRCATSNPLTPGQLYPSGAQPAPSTNPGLGVSRLPGQPLGTGLIPTGGTDVPGQLSGQPTLTGNQFVTSAGPGAATAGTGTGALLPNTSTDVGTGINVLTDQANPSNVATGMSGGGTVGGNAYVGGSLPAGTGATPASGLLPGNANAFNSPGAVPGTGVISGSQGPASVAVTDVAGANIVRGTGTTSDGVAAVSGTVDSTGTVVPGVVSTTGGLVTDATTNTAGSILPGSGTTIDALPTINTSVLPGGTGLPNQVSLPVIIPATSRGTDPTGAYGFSLSSSTAAPAGPTAAAGPQPPLPPGRGGPTYIGEERSGATSVAR